MIQPVVAKIVVFGEPLDPALASALEAAGLDAQGRPADARAGLMVLTSSAGDPLAAGRTAPASLPLVVASASVDEAWIAAECRDSGWIWIAPSAGFREAVIGALLAVLAERTAPVGDANETDLHRQIEEARARALAADRSKGAFLANMSHELRTPLTAILGYTDMVAEELEDRKLDDLLPDLDRVRYAAKHLLTIVDDVLELARLEGGQVKLELERVEIAALLADVARQVAVAARVGGNRVEIECEEAARAMTSDARRLRQCLQHLADNACKFTKNGTITLGARRLAAAGSARIELYVRDTGIGMAAELVERMFQPFSQGDESRTRETGGTGLGLAIIDRLCRLLGAQIAVESTPGAGSTFRLRLLEDQSTLPTRRMTMEIGSTAGVATRGSVWVLGASAGLAAELEAVLAHRRMRALTVETIDEAEHALSAEPPTALLVVVSGPHFAGWTLWNDLRGRFDLGDRPVVLVPTLADGSRGLAIPARTCLTKPVRRDALAAAFERLPTGDSALALIFDRDPLSRDLARRLLDARGFECVDVDTAAALPIGSARLAVLDPLDPESATLRCLPRLLADPALAIVVVAGAQLGPLERSFYEHELEVATEGKNRKDLLGAVEQALMRL